MSQYQVEKQQADASIYLVDGQTREGVLFLSPFSSSGTGQQTVVDLLREPDPFLPFIGSDKAFLLINKSQISHISFQPHDDAPPPLGDPVEVSVTFINGKQLAGTIVLEVPEGKRRLIDYMNSSPDYIELDQGDAHYLINPAVIIEIAPQE